MRQIVTSPPGTRSTAARCASAMCWQQAPSPVQRLPAARRHRRRHRQNGEPDSRNKLRTMPLGPAVPRTVMRRPSLTLTDVIRRHSNQAENAATSSTP
jgi:hypothetical protein